MWVTQEKKIECQAKPGRQCRQVSFNIVSTQFTNKEKCHACDADRNNSSVEGAKFLFKEQRFEYQDINRCGVLKKNSIGRRRLFCRNNEKYEERRIKERREGRHPVKSEPFAPR